MQEQRAAVGELPADAHKAIHRAIERGGGLGRLRLLPVKLFEENPGCLHHRLQRAAETCRRIDDHAQRKQFAVAGRRGNEQHSAADPAHGGVIDRAVEQQANLQQTGLIPAGEQPVVILK